MRIRDVLRRRMKNQAGFTLTELLLTTLILLMVSAVVAAGVPSAANAYNKVMDAANAQVLLSTTITRLRQELTLATEVETMGAGDDTVKTFSTDAYSDATLSQQDENGVKGIALNGKLLVTKAAATKGMSASFSALKYKDGVFTVERLEVKKNEKTLAGPVTIEIQAVRNP